MIPRVPFFRQRSRLPIPAIMAAALLLMFMLSCHTGGLAKGETAVTLLVYMTGSDLETKGQAASMDIMEMAKSLPAGRGIRLLLQAGGAESWQLDIDPSKTTRMEISDGQWHKIDELENRNMADAETLSMFLRWGCAYAPADRYALILWDHGAGPLLGVCLDELHPAPDNSFDSLSLRELRTALSNSPFANEKLLFIGFDACLMSTLEVASAVSPYAEYMIASQETEPVSGWDYAFLRDLSGHEDGKALGRHIVDAYLESQKGSMKTATLSCLDLGKTNGVLTQMDIFFSTIKDRITKETYPAYTRCRINARTLGGRTTFAFDLIDLADLTEQYEKHGLADGTALCKALSEMVVCHCAANTERTNGISIYYPFENKARYIASWSSVYQKDSFSPVYRSFIRHISDFYLQDSLFRMNSDFLTELQEEAGTVRVRVPLTEEDASRFVKSRMIVLEKVGEDAYRFVYYNDQSIQSTNQGISSRYAGEGLFAVSREGEILQGPISYFPVENGVAVYGFLFFGLDMYPVRVVFLQNGEGRLIPSQVLTAQGDGPDQVFLPSALDLEKSTELLLVSFGPAGEGENTLTSLNYSLFFPEFTYHFDPTDPDLELALIPGWSRYDRYVYLRLTDVYGETVCSSPVTVPSLGHLSVTTPCELESGADITARLTEGALVIGNDAGLMFAINMCSQAEDSLTLRTVRISLNSGIRFEPSQFKSSMYALAPGKEEEVLIFIPLKSLQSVPLPEEITEADILFSAEDEHGNIQEYSLSIPMTMDTSIIIESP